MITAAGLPRGHVHIREVRGDEIEVKPRKVCRELRLVCTIYQAERLGAVTAQTGEWAREGILRRRSLYTGTYCAQVSWASIVAKTCVYTRGVTIQT